MDARCLCGGMCGRTNLMTWWILSFVGPSSSPCFLTTCAGLACRCLWLCGVCISVRRERESKKEGLRKNERNHLASAWSFLMFMTIQDLSTCMYSHIHIHLHTHTHSTGTSKPPPHQPLHCPFAAMPLPVPSSPFLLLSFDP
jgi:hypothetical protein